MLLHEHIFAMEAFCALPGMEVQPHDNGGQSTVGGTGRWVGWGARWGAGWGGVFSVQLL
jgi:hypothetical protein